MVQSYTDDILGGLNSSAAFMRLRGTAPAVYDLADGAGTITLSDPRFQIEGTAADDFDITMAAGETPNETIDIVVDNADFGTNNVRLMIAGNPTPSVGTLRANRVYTVRWSGTSWHRIATAFRNSDPGLIASIENAGDLASLDAIDPAAHTTGVSQHRLALRFSAGSGALEMAARGNLTLEAAPSGTFRVIGFDDAGNLREANNSTLGGAAAPSIVAATAGTHPLTSAQRGHLNVWVIATSATDIEIPANAAAGDSWDGWALTAGVVTVSTVGNVGSINGSAGATKTLAGNGAYWKATVTSNPGSAPVVQLEGEVAEDRVLTGKLDCADFEVSRPVLRDVAEAFFDAGNKSGAASLDYTQGGWQRLAATGNITSLAITNPPASGKGGSLLLEIRQDATGGRTIAWGAAFRFAGGTDATLSTAANAVDFFTINTRDAGSTWWVFEGGKGFAA